MSELLRINNLNFAYEDNNVFEDFCCSIMKNRLTLLVGANGAGKSTLLNIISGVITVTDKNGDFYWNDKKSSLNNIQDNIAYAQSMPALFFGLSGFENITICKLLFNENECYEKMTLSFCNSLGLSDKDLTKDIAKYSQGMLQKLWLSIILTRKKDLYLLDEPFNGLDSFAINYLQEYILGMRKTLLIVSHEPPYKIYENSIKISIDHVS